MKRWSATQWFEYTALAVCVVALVAVVIVIVHFVVKFW
jgi:uncharacterized membrane protein YcjF (UPF0283 family)